jgi:hypothetical protein
MFPTKKPSRNRLGFYWNVLADTYGFVSKFSSSEYAVPLALVA